MKNIDKILSILVNRQVIEVLAIAIEGTLKIKEISCVHAEAFAAGELKQGSISLIDKVTIAIKVYYLKK